MKSRRTSPAPITFLSYSHESHLQGRRVRALADRLRAEAGCDTRLDQYAESAVANWPQWMRRELTAADFVLMVFSPTYRRRFDGRERAGKGLGVTWEGAVITNQLYASGGNSLKFIPVVFRDSDLQFVPREIFSGTTYVLPKDWQRLISRLWGRPLLAPPPIAAAPDWTMVQRSPGNLNSSTPLPRSLSVLFVGAQRGTGLDLRYQLRQTKKAIMRGRLAAKVLLKGVFNITPDEMLMEIQGNPPDVLHLSGKQAGGQVKMHDSSGKLTPISAERLAEALLQFKDSLRLVILDTCDSLAQARRLTEEIDCALGVQKGIAEPVAIDFYSMFFNALASGRSVHDAWAVAYKLELSKLDGDSRYRSEIEEILEEPFRAERNLPQLVCRRGVDPKKVFLIEGFAGK